LFVGISNVINFIGGFNGSESGMGIIYLFTLGLYALIQLKFSYILFFISFAALLGFIRYNWYPAKILSGDSLTYLLGAIVAGGIIVGNMEKIGLLVLLPFIVEFFLKLRSRFKASCLGKLRQDGKLNPPYGKKIYSLTHIIMNIGSFTEYGVSLILILTEFVVCILVLYMFL